MISYARYRFILFVMAFCLCNMTVFAQAGFYVPNQGKIFFKGDTATIFSNVINEGKFGIGQNAVVNFSGQRWKNEPLAEITDESNGGLGVSGTGGWVRFIADSFRQQLDGGYNAATRKGPVFQHVQLRNAFGIELNQSSAKIGNIIDFKQGLFYLGNQMLVVGNNNPGSIKGYDSLRYFVTDPGSGMLVRENIRRSDNWIVFPIGSKEKAYTPAALRNLSAQGDDYFAAVWDSVRSGISTGGFLANESVNKTWQIGKRLAPDQGEVEIALQHQNSDEGSNFSLNKTKAYVSQYNNGNSWDVGYPQNFPGTGYLSSGAPLVSSGVNGRVFSAIGFSSYFTKLTGAGDTSLTRLWFNAYRLDPSNVKVYWMTKPEININYFVVQRRLANEANFKNVDTVLSLASNGYSLQELNYTNNDPNGYTGISFYRLMSIAHSKDSAYSQIVAVGNRTGEFQSELWPNPTSGIFYLSLNTLQTARKIIIWNGLGQKVLEQETNGLRVIRVDATKLAQGTYWVSIVGNSDTILETKKLIIAR